MLCWVKRFRYKYMIGIPAFLALNTTISSEGGVGFSHIFFSLALYSSLRVAKTKLHSRTKSIDLHLKLLSIKYSNYSVKFNQSHAL